MKSDLMSASRYFWASQEAQWQKRKKKVCLLMQLTQEIGFDLWVRKIPWKRKWQPPPVFLSGKPHGQRSLAGYSPWSHRVSHNWACTISVILILFFRTHPKHYFYLSVETFSCVNSLNSWSMQMAFCYHMDIYWGGGVLYHYIFKGPKIW